MVLAALFRPLLRQLNSKTPFILLGTVLSLLQPSGALASPGASSQGQRTLVVGDPHGDLHALKTVLIGLGLLDRHSDNWTGGQANLVVMGDLIDRGPQSRAVMDLMMKLESQAQQTGGKVESLIGNHELLAVMGKNESYLNMNDPMSFREFRQGPRQSGMDGYFNAFRGSSPYAQWIRSRPTMVVIGDSLFVHAGVDEWALQHSPQEINNMVKAWIEFEQGVGEQPAESTAWVIQGKGPLWSRRLAAKMDAVKEMANKDKVPSETLDKILQHLHVKRVFIGHSLAAGIPQSLYDTTYGNKVIMTDLGLTESDGGPLVGFEVDGQGQVKAIQFSRKNGSLVNVFKQESSSSSLFCRQAMGG